MTDTSSDNRQMLSDLPEAPVEEHNGQQDNTTLPGQPQQESFSDVAVKPECGAVEKQTPPNKTAGQEKQETSASRLEEDNSFGMRLVLLVLSFSTTSVSLYLCISVSLFLCFSVSVYFSVPLFIQLQTSTYPICCLGR